MQTINAIQAVHLMLADKLASARILVDATAGNGSDTLFMAEGAATGSAIYAFDIQQSALDEVQCRLSNIDTAADIRLINDSHANINKYLSENEYIDIAVFNLGYLPGGSHELTTMTDSTMQAVNCVVESLNLNGILAITAYPGHAEGAKEKTALEEWLLKLSSHDFTVVKYEMINHKSNAPVSYFIEKVRR